jgi:hypothetical protein
VKRRALLLAVLLAGAASAQGTFREITWEELVPTGWDPMKDVRGLSNGILSDADPRAQQALKKLREIWDNAPTNGKVDGQKIRIPGYVVPLEESKAGLKEFLLVPYFGACIHTPPPPSNQIVHVLPAKAASFRSMDTVWVNGTLRVARHDSVMGASSYRLEATTVEPYVETAEAPKKP